MLIGYFYNIVMEGNLNNNNRLLIILIIALFNIIFSNCICYSANWQLYIVQNGNKFLVDDDSIIIDFNNNELILWFKIINYDGSYIISRDLVNIKEKYYFVLQLTSYDARGNVLYSSNRIANMEHIIPGSIYEKIINDIIISHKRKYIEKEKPKKKPTW